MRIPNNIIKVKYTSGNEYVLKLTNNTYYTGYYYEMNAKFFIGKKFDINAKELIKINKSNKRPDQNSIIFDAISGIKSQQIQKPVLSNNNSQNYITFYCKKINEQNILIKKIDEDTYLSLQNNPLYQTTYIGIYNKKEQNIEEANKHIPGLKIFLLG